MAKMIDFTYDKDTSTGKATNLDDATDFMGFDFARDIPNIWNVWNTLDDIEKYTVRYGHRQVVSDRASGEKTAKGKLAKIRARHNQLFVDRKIVGDGTGSGIKKIQAERDQAIKAMAEMQAEFLAMKQQMEDMQKKLTKKGK